MKSIEDIRNRSGATRLVDEMWAKLERGEDIDLSAEVKAMSKLMGDVIPLELYAVTPEICQPCGKMTDTGMFLVKGDTGHVPACKACRDEFVEDWCRDIANITLWNWSEFTWNKGRKEE